MTINPEHLSAEDEAFLDEVFDLALRCRSTGEAFDLGAIASRRPHLRDRVLRISELARDVAVSSPPPAPGHRFGPYRILEQIGRGGQATVYLAQDTHLDRKVALKILDPAPAGSRQTIERFTREAEITSKLDHPGICVVYDSGESGGSFWIAMRYVDGESFANKIGAAKARPDSSDPQHQLGPKTPVEVSQLLAIFEKAARALHVAHEHGVIHRDMKPGNIMLNREGEPVILDFGLAHEIDGGQVTLTLTGALMGTPAYMSPEQVAGERLRLDRRTDVYSLGVSLYECLTLDRPFDAPTRDGLYQAILTKAPPDVRASNHAVSKDLKVVLETAMEKDRDRRYQTALDLAQDLERVRKHEPIVAKPIGPIGRLERWSKRNPALALAVGGLFAALTTGLGTSLFLLAQRDQALGEKSAALSEKSAALSDYDRLGDWSRLQRLEAVYEKLWPCEPSMVPAMKAWLDQAKELEQRLPGHREVLDRLRSSKGLLPYTDEDRAADFQAHDAERTELDLRRRQRARGLSELGGTTSRGTETDEEWRRILPNTLESLEHDIRCLERSIEERLTWKFGTSADQFKHDTTAKLVSELTAFVDRESTKGMTAIVQKNSKPWMVGNVRGRLAFAELVESNTIGKYRAEWAEAIRSIADQTESPAYRGLKITPQLGLIPIGKDPGSGLWEFMNLITSLSPTEPIPKRDTGGRLVVTESMGLVFVLIPGGKFRMGAIKPDEDQALSEPNVDPDAEPSEVPITEVELEPFFISKYEMMEIQWIRITPAPDNYYLDGLRRLKVGPDRNPVPCNPVGTVSWQDCDLGLTRLGLVLPTEAQWEHAARGGTTTPRWTGIGADDLAKAANVRDVSAKMATRLGTEGESWDDGYAAQAPVGSFAPNPFGLHDVLGNVAEWCRDEAVSYEASPRPGDGLRLVRASLRQQKMTRGGHFADRAALVRSAARSAETADRGLPGIGVRPAMAIRRD